MPGFLYALLLFFQLFTYRCAGVAEVRVLQGFSASTGETTPRSLDSVVGQLLNSTGKFSAVPVDSLTPAGAKVFVVAGALPRLAGQLASNGPQPSSTAGLQQFVNKGGILIVTTSPDPNNTMAFQLISAVLGLDVQCSTPSTTSGTVPYTDVRCCGSCSCGPLHKLGSTDFGSNIYPSQLFDSSNGSYYTQCATGQAVYRFLEMQPVVLWGYGSGLIVWFGYTFDPSVTFPEHPGAAAAWQQAFTFVASTDTRAAPAPPPAIPQPAAVVNSTQTELETLVALKKLLVTPTSTCQLTSWNLSTSAKTPMDVCAVWESMECLDGGGWKLDLNSCGFSGPVPALLQSFKTIQALVVTSNTFTGTLPTSWSVLTTLTYINAGSNKFVGTIPSEWSALTNLQLLSVDLNSLSGNIPPSYTALPSLKVLSAVSSGLTGSVPGWWTDLARLSYLNMANNRLTGTLPAEWANFGTRMDALYLTGNTFSGSIPDAWSRLVKLRSIHLEAATGSDILRLTGTLPASWSAMTSLTTLFFGGARGPVELQGTIPQQWSTLARLTNFMVANTNVSGTLPDWLGGATNLVLLFLYGNQLHGTLPDSWSSLGHLSSLLLDGNYPDPARTDQPGITGTIPASWASGMTALQQLQLTIATNTSAGVCGAVPPSVNASITWPRSTVLPVLPACSASPAEGQDDSSSSSKVNKKIVAIAAPVAVGGLLLLATCAAVVCWLAKRNEWCMYGKSVYGIDDVVKYDAEAAIPPNKMDREDTSDNGMVYTVVEVQGTPDMNTPALLKAGDGKFDANWWNSLPPMARRFRWISAAEAPADAAEAMPEGDEEPQANDAGAGSTIQLSAQQLINEVVLVADGVVASGSRSAVYKGLWRGRFVAVKVLLYTVDFSEDNLNEFKTEIEILGRIRHPHIMRLYRGCVEPSLVCLLEELMPTNLELHIHGATQQDDCSRTSSSGSGSSATGSSAPRRQLSHFEVVRICADVARGLACLHPDVVHRDLKPSNVLLDAQGRAQISDFGLARSKISAYLSTEHPTAGTSAYMAPECFNPELSGITEFTDIYSFGVLLWECWTGRRPWEGHNHWSIMYRVMMCKQHLPLHPGDDIETPLAPLATLPYPPPPLDAPMEAHMEYAARAAAAGPAPYPHGGFPTGGVAHAISQQPQAQPTPREPLREFPLALQLLLLCCWQADPKERPTAPQIVAQLEATLHYWGSL